MGGAPITNTIKLLQRCSNRLQNSPYFAIVLRTPEERVIQTEGLGREAKRACEARSIARDSPRF